MFDVCIQTENRSPWPRCNQIGGYQILALSSQDITEIMISLILMTLRDRQ